ncbi:45 kDa calcium-binding protein isoform X1 [Saimiri boliviensis]|uniref:45 kDa calcium-binding protein isoform X1 n=1 Tax=Saimiri boliviensis TaxID=27679 RepID=UPI003D78A148
MVVPASRQRGRARSRRPRPQERWQRPEPGLLAASRALRSAPRIPGAGRQADRELLAVRASGAALPIPSLWLSWGPGPLQCLGLGLEPDFTSSPAPAPPSTWPWVAMASRWGPLVGLAPHCLWLLGAVLLMDASARPANHTSTRERAAHREENEILPPDHLNGVKLEVDGHLNRDFHQEVFLGRDLGGFDEDTEPRRSRRKLMVIFSKVDVNSDRKISAKEMQRWIMEKTAEHFQEAMEESKMHFRAVDPDGDGHVSWDEYKVRFLASKGHSEKEVADAIRLNEELKVDEETQEVLENLKDRWYQADSPPADLLLTEPEFLSFLHPEHSRGMLRFMVKEIVRDLGEAGPARRRTVGTGRGGRSGRVLREPPPRCELTRSRLTDQDGDKQLSLPEFISLPVGTVENQQGQDIDDNWVRDRKKEFEELIDSDHDGIVTAEELESYMDPMNEYNALNEAKQMIAVADENQNQHLEPEEMLKYSEFFTGSKLVDYARSVHEEF